MTDQEIFKAAIEKWGDTPQINQSLEECGELIVAVNKFRRAVMWAPELIEKRRMELCGEIADVLNCMDQMKMMFGAGDVDRIRREKMERLKHILGI